MNGSALSSAGTAVTEHERGSRQDLSTPAGAVTEEREDAAGRWSARARIRTDVFWRAPVNVEVDVTATMARLFGELLASHGENTSTRTRRRRKTSVVQLATPDLGTKIPSESRRTPTCTRRRRSRRQDRLAVGMTGRKGDETNLEDLVEMRSGE